MVNPKVLEILRKYADERDPTASVIPDRERVANFAHELHLKLRTVLAELEHDVGLLKSRKFDKDMTNLLSGVWHYLEKLYLAFNQHDPYQTAREISKYLNDKHTRAVIDNLIFLSEHHVKTTNVKDLVPSKVLVHPEVRGLKLLLQLQKFADDALKEPAPASFQQTWRPPSTQSMEAVKIPVLPPLASITPSESPEAKKQKETETA